MPQQQLLNLESRLSFRNKLNENFTELYAIKSDFADPVQGANLVAFQQAGTGAGLRSVNDELTETFKVTQYQDGGVDISVALARTVDSLPSTGGVVEFPSGEFTLPTEVLLTLTGKKNITLKGNQTRLKAGATRIRNYFRIIGGENIQVTGFVFDQLKASLPTYTLGDYGNLYNCPIHCDGTTGLQVFGNTFEDLYTTAVSAYQSNDVSVYCNRFLSGLQTQDQWMQHVHIQTCGGNNIVAWNVFKNAVSTNPAVNAAGVFASGITGSLSVVHNSFDYCGRNNAGGHRVGVVDVYGDAQNVTVEHNTATNCLGQFMRLSSTRNGMVRHNRIHVHPSSELDYSVLTLEGSIAFGGQKGIEDIWVTENTIEDPSSRAAYAVGVLAYDWGYPSKNIHVLRNKFSGCRRSTLVRGPFENLHIEDNEVRGAAGQIDVQHAVGITATYGTEAAAVFDGLHIRHNTHRDPGITTNAVAIDLLKAPAFTGTYGAIYIEDNDFRAAAANGGQAISCRFGASTPSGEAYVRRNTTKNYTYDWYLLSMPLAVVEGNRAISTVTAPLLTSAVTVVQRSGNRLSVGAMSGSVAMTGAGAVTINTAEIRTGDFVRVIRQNLTGAGTFESLLTANIVNGVSFEISSPGTTGNAVVFWEIVH